VTEPPLNSNLSTATKIKIGLPYNPIIPLLSVYPKELRLRTIETAARPGL
jgi:hypothetical protein